MNNFIFNGKHYLQIHGTAMGTRMAPSYANLFLAKFEADALSRAPYKPHTWWRYIDDIFMIRTHSVDDLHAFTSYLNSIHPTIKFTSNYSFTSIPFLDVNISFSDSVRKAREAYLIERGQTLEPNGRNKKDETLY